MRTAEEWLREFPMIKWEEFEQDVSAYIRYIERVALEEFEQDVSAYIRYIQRDALEAAALACEGMKFPQADTFDCAAAIRKLKP